MLTLVAWVGIASSQAKDLLSDEQRWESVRSSNDIGDMGAYLRSYPEGAHAEEARARLRAWDNRALARLVTDTPECRQAVQTRVRSMLTRPVAAGHMARYDWTPPGPGTLLDEPSFLVLPKGQTKDTARIEDWVQLNLVADRRGECIVMLRWSHGSGLPSSCRCTPRDPAYDFGPPPRAEGVLKDEARMQADVEMCQRDFALQGAAQLPQQYRELRVSLAREWSAAAKARRAAGQALLPTEEDELLDWEESLPVLSKPGLHEAAYQQRQQWQTSQPRDQLAALCSGLVGRIEGLMSNSVITTKMRR